MTAPARENTGVARREQPTTIDIGSAKASAKFLDAYNGKLERMNPEQQSMFLIALGQRLGVRAELGELILYQGKPYISIDGRIRLAHETGLLVGMETRPATQLERRNYGCEDGDALWVCNVYRRGAARAFVGWGHVSTKDRNPVTKTHPREMAKKRAKYDALRTAFPPAENISMMHQQYIEEAEQAIRDGQSLQNHAFQALSSGMDDAAEEVVQTEGHEVASDQGADTPPAGELFDTPAPRAPSAQSQGR